MVSSNKIEVHFEKAGKRLAVKFGAMRKADEVVVMKQGDGNLYFQGDRMIGVVDQVTGKCILNYKGSNPKYNIHLSRVLGAEVVELPADFVDALKTILIGPGHAIGPGVILAGVPEEACAFTQAHDDDVNDDEYTCTVHKSTVHASERPVACPAAQAAAYGAVEVRK